MIVYSQERLADIRHEIEALVPQQWEEMAKGFSGTPDPVQWDLYLQFEQQGRLILLTARIENRLIGYFGAFLYVVDGKEAVRSAPYYVVPTTPPTRRALILRRMIKMLKEKCPGRDLLIKTHPWASAAPILEHLGFRAVETWYMLAGKQEPPDA